MIQITINYRDSRGEHSYQYDVQAVPRTGEFVKLYGDWYKVNTVLHDTLNVHQRITIRVHRMEDQ